MKRWAFAVMVLVLAGVGAWWWFHDGDAPAPADDAQLSANEGAVPLAALKSKWNDPIVQRGSRRVTGVVLRDGAPVSGATITALAAHGDDVLSDLPCQCDNHCGQKLLACGCAEASGQLVELLGARTGEAAPLGRATSGNDGTFTIEGLDESTLTLWADAPGAIGWLTDVASDASEVKLNVSTGRTIKGKVTTSKDTPASGALVTAIFAEQSRFFETNTKADGTFEIGPMPKGQYAVVAMQEGLLPDHQQTREGRDELALELNVPRALSGKVMLDGKPVAAAKVKLEGMHRKRTVFTDSQGTFRVERLRPGEYELHAEGSGALGTAKPTVNKREDREGVVIELVRGVPLDGVVVDETGAPIAGVKLTISLNAGSWTRAESDAKGLFHLDTVPEGPCQVIAKKEGFLAEDVQTVTGGSARATITMLRASVLSGRVQTADGVVVSEFMISARQPDAGARSRDDFDDVVVGSSKRAPGSWARSGSDDGGFSLDLTPGEFEVLVQSDKFLDERLTLRAPASDVVITLKPGGVIRGTLLDNEGAPVARAMIIGSGEHAMKDAKTDETGHFALEGLIAGKWKVVARPDFSSKGMWSASTTVEVMLGREVTVELRQPTGAKIAGVVLDAAGNPVAQARVNAGNDDSLKPGDEQIPTYEMVSTDDNGHFILRTMPAGKVELEVSTKDSARKTLTIIAPDENVIVKLEEGTFITGRVVDESSRVVKEFKVSGQTFDTEDGHFKVRALAGRQQHFAIDSVGYAQHLFDVDVKEGKNELGDIKISHGLKVTGLVVDAKTKAPIVGALIDVSAEKPKGEFYLSESRGAVMSDAKGRYTITVDPASAWLVATHKDYVASSVALPFDAKTLDIPMESGNSVTVSVVDAQGQPVPDARVWANGPANAMKVLMPSATAGSFTANAFTAGEWTFRAMTRGDRITFEKLTVTLGETAQTLVLHELTGGIDITFTTPTPVRRMVLVNGHISATELREKMIAYDFTPITNNVAKHVQPGPWTVVMIEPPQLALHPITVTATGPAKVEFTPNWQPLPE